MAKVERVDLTVQDKAIHCSGCESRIETVLKKLPGVVKVKADHKTQRVAITLDTDRTSASEMKRRLELAGYRTGLVGSALR
ncbi:MAG: heavy-metal-associated domain-containing protein [Chloroflexi bacterium]|nr:heavy-metal-associated domain-containing protein [Chloroflexota bacterium]